LTIGPLAVLNSTFIPSTGGPCSVVLSGSAVGTFAIDPSASARGAIDLRNFRPGRFSDASQLPAETRLLAQIQKAKSDAGTSPPTWLLDGFHPARINAFDDRDTTERANWLSCGGEGDAPANRGTYRAFAEAYSRDGHDDGATEILIAMRKAHDPLWQRRMLAPIAHGYKPQRALPYLLAAFAFALIMSIIGDTKGWFVASQDLGQNASLNGQQLVRSDQCLRERYPCLRPEIHALDTVIPVVDFGARSLWKPDTHRRAGRWPNVLEWSLDLAALMGWAFGGLFVIGAVNVAMEQRRKPSE
jgi:hypothetical protein